MIMFIEYTSQKEHHIVICHLERAPGEQRYLHDGVHEPRVPLSSFWSSSWMACSISCSCLVQCSFGLELSLCQSYKKDTKVYMLKKIDYKLKKKKLVMHFLNIYESCKISITYLWSAHGWRISNSLSLPKISNHSLFTDWLQLLSSRRSKFWSRSITETSCAKNGTTAAWTRFHKVCLSEKIQNLTGLFPITGFLMQTHFSLARDTTWMCLLLAKHQSLKLLWWPSYFCQMGRYYCPELTATSADASLQSEEIHLTI